MYVVVLQTARNCRYWYNTVMPPKIWSSPTIVNNISANKAELKLFIENSETQDHFELIDENQFIVKIKKAIAPDEHGNLQFQVLFNTDYANQRWALMLLNNR